MWGNYGGRIYTGTSFKVRYINRSNNVITIRSQDGDFTDVMLQPSEYTDVSSSVWEDNGDGGVPLIATPPNSWAQLLNLFLDIDTPNELSLCRINITEKLCNIETVITELTEKVCNIEETIDNMKNKVCDIKRKTCKIMHKVNCLQASLCYYVHKRLYYQENKINNRLNLLNILKLNF